MGSALLGTPFRVFVGLLALCAIARIVELAVSAHRARGRPGALVPEPRVFPVMVALHVGLVLLPPLEVLTLSRPFLPPLAAGAAALLLLATALRVWTLRTLGRSWNVRVIEPQVVATTGPYAYIRHPNYLAVVLEIAALPLLHTAWISAALLSLVNGFVLARRMRVEEAVLRRLPSWRERMEPRARLIPGIY